MSGRILVDALRLIVNNIIGVHGGERGSDLRSEALHARLAKEYHWLPTMFHSQNQLLRRFCKVRKVNASILISHPVYAGFFFNPWLSTSRNSLI